MALQGKNEMEMTLGDRIKQARISKGYTQPQLGEQSQLDQPEISRLESGIYTRTSKMVDLAKALDVNPNWLQYGRGEMKKTAGHQAGEKAAPPTDAALETVKSPVDTVKDSALDDLKVKVEILQERLNVIEKRITFVESKV